MFKLLLALTLGLFISAGLSACGGEEEAQIRGNALASNVANTAPAVFPSRGCGEIPGYALNGKTSPGFYSHWHLRVDKAGYWYWNGVQTPDEVVRGYLQKLHAMKSQEDYLSIEIEPGAMCDRVGHTRRMAVESGLCSEGRCTENSWNIKSPIVN